MRRDRRAEAELAVQIGVVGRAEPCGLGVDDLGRVEVKAVQVLFGEIGAELRRRCRVPRSSSFIRRGRSIRNGISSPSCLALKVASSCAIRSASAVTKLAEVALARELPQLTPRADAVDRCAEAERGLELGQPRVRARRSARGRTSPSGPRSGGTPPRRARSRTARPRRRDRRFRVAEAAPPWASVGYGPCTRSSSRPSGSSS